MCVDALQFHQENPNSYASIGAILMSPKIAKGIRDAAGVWKHGHTYQVLLFLSMLCLYH